MRPSAPAATDARPIGYGAMLFATALTDDSMADNFADPQRTGTPRVDAPVLRTIPSCTFPDVDSPQKNVVLHRIERTSAESA